MNYIFLRKKLVFRSKVLYNINGKVVIHYKAAFPRSFRVAASLINRLEIRKSIPSPRLIIVLTENRRGVYYTCTVSCRYIIRAGHEMRLFVELSSRYQSFVLVKFEFFTLHLSKHFVISLSEHPVCCRCRKVIYFSLVISCGHFNFYIIYIRSYCKRHIGKQRPRRSRPGEIIFVRRLSLKFAGSCKHLHFLVTLRHFVRSKSRSTARTVRKNFCSLVNQPFLEYRIEYPPARLYIVVVKSDICVVEVCHIRHILRHLAPRLFVCKY